MDVPHADRQPQKYRPDIEQRQSLNQRRHLLPYNLPTFAVSLLVMFSVRITHRLRAKHRILIRGSICLSLYQLEPYRP